MGIITSSILSKAIWMVLAFTIMYLIADPFGLVPQDVKGTVSWFGANITLFVVAICFLAALYVYLKIKTHHRKEES